MDSITHITNKMLAERARQQRQHTPAESAPPPYSAADDDSDSEDDEDEPPVPMKLTVNAAHNIQGCNNLIPTSPQPLADATKFSTLLLHALNQINAANAATSCDVTCSRKRRRALKVDLTINCGITVVGDRNVIGHVAMKQREPVPGASSNAAVAGAKRKAGDSSLEHGEQPATKRIAAVEEQ